MRWIELESVPGKKMPRWQRSAGLGDDGTVYAPAAMGGNEQAVMLCAGYDGITLVSYLNHVFVSTDWLAKEYPQLEGLCEAIVKKVNKIADSAANAEIEDAPGD
ncbi:hypothetical protein [Pseudomonas sp. NPDC096950]|uniref:hypothetical protein n=1 Tax=Pseudomonas sp. NPDC096950 TaxID=3364485 RepID=UPI00383B924F